MAACSQNGYIIRAMWTCHHLHRQLLCRGLQRGIHGLATERGYFGVQGHGKRVGVLLVGHRWR